MTGKFISPASNSLAEVDCGCEGGVVYGDHCVVVEGVVGPGGGSIWVGFQKIDGKLQQAPGYDVHLFALAGWRFPGEPLVGRELTMLRPVPPSIPDVKT